jgi:hypothetical protein
LALEVWGGATAALGKRFRVTSNDPWREVVGVAGDVREDGLGEPSPTTVYFPVLADGIWGQPTLLWRATTLAVRTPRAGTGALLNEIENAVWSVNASLPVAAARTLGDLYARSLARTSFTLALLGAAGAMALALSLVGIYGVIAYGVARRSREIGIRLALGASPAGVQSLFAQRALSLVAIGTLAGLVAASGLTRLMESLLFGVAPLDLATFVAVPALLLPVAMLATYLPARRALRLNPMDALRDE